MEQELRGGGLTPVARAGDTVRREAGPWTASVQALLRHVRGRGLDWAPEPRGLDGDGREVLGFVEGEVYNGELPGWAWEEDVLAAAGRMLRAYHDATAGFPRAGRRWRVPSHTPDEVICHNDFAPYNFVFRGRTLCAVIDFDTASPGPRVWDLAYLAYRLVPLAAPSNPEVPASSRPTRERRLALLCSAYGGADPATVLAVAPDRLDELAAFTATRPELRPDVALYEADARHLRGGGI